MKYRIPYADPAERQAVLDANTALSLVGEDNHVDGNFLVFDAKPFVDEKTGFIKLTLATLTRPCKAVLKLCGDATIWMAKKIKMVQ